MKRTFIFLAALLANSYAFGQNTFPASGNVGIGTNSPTSLLDVRGEAKFLSSFLTASNSPFSASSIYTSNVGFHNIFGVDGSWGSKYFGMKTNGDFLINGGNVGIGTVTPTEKLSVKGKIRAQEIKIEVTGWADFVFAKDYKLPTLLETENHIKEKGHLPGIPSAAEVQANGIELGVMNKKLLQKIEELTLYLIEQKKAIQTLNDKVEVLQKDHK